MKIAYKRGEEDEVQVTAKKLPMDKDPVFRAQLRREIIADHNRKIAAKKK